MADSLESILKDLREQLLTNVNAQPIADDACDKEIIPEELKTSINQAKSVREANMILYQHLLQQGTQSMLKELCTIMINAKGYGRMIEFGQVLLTKVTAPVEQGIEVCQQNGSDGIEVMDRHMSWQIDRIAKERTWDSVLKLYHWICARVADLLQGRLPIIKVLIGNHYTSKCSPYDKLTQQDLENIRSCDLIDQIMQIVGISKQWLDVSYLEHFIRDMADPPTVDRTELWLNRYKQLLQYVCCKVLLRDAPGDHEVLQGLLRGVEAKIQSSRVLIVIHDIEYNNFNVAQLLKEKECLEKLLGIRPGCLNCLRVEPAHSVAIYWLIDKRHIARVMLDGRQIFWPLLLSRVTSLELVGSLTLSLKGGHVPYLIRDALLAGQNLIQQTEVFSRQFLALVGPTDHPLENSNNAEVQHRRLLMRLLKAPPSHRFFLQESHDKDVPQTLEVEHESQVRKLEDVLPKSIVGIHAGSRVLGAFASRASTTASAAAQSPLTPPPTMATTTLPQADTAIQFSASEFLKKHETEFFEVIDPRRSLLRLVRKCVITEDIRSDINTSNTDDAREVLYHHLAHHANVDTLKEYLRVAIAADGYPKMQSLGRKMMEELEQGGEQTH